jgi:hypothetical protein
MLELRLGRFLPLARRSSASTWRRIASRCRTARQTPAPCLHRARIERLVQHIHRARLIALERIVQLLAGRRDKHDRNLQVFSVPRISSASSKPSMPGICTSRMASAKSLQQQQCHASSPEPALMDFPRLPQQGSSAAGFPAGRLRSAAWWGCVLLIRLQHQQQVCISSRTKSDPAAQPDRFLRHGRDLGLCRVCTTVKPPARPMAAMPAAPS